MHVCTRILFRRIMLNNKYTQYTTHKQSALIEQININPYSFLFHRLL